MPNSIFEPLLTAKQVSATKTNVVKPRRHSHLEIDLSGKWKFKPDPEEIGEEKGWFECDYPDRDWEEVGVPVNFVEIPGLENFFKPVWFRKTFRVEEKYLDLDARLIFEGVDYLAEVWLNGKKLGTHEGYFCPFRFESKLQRENVLAVKVCNPFDRGIRFMGFFSGALSTKHCLKGVLNYHDCRPGDSLTPKLSQSMGTGGIYRPVKLKLVENHCLDWVFLTPVLEDGNARLLMDIFFSSTVPEDVLLLVEIPQAKKRLSYRVNASRGCNHVELETEIRDPKLWFPWDHEELGKPFLYSVRTQLVRGDSCVDERTDRTGLRTIKLGGELDRRCDRRVGEDAYHWYLNGRKIFVRGTNYLSTEWMAKAESLYEKDIKLLKECWINMVRVHAHIEPKRLYELLDEHGIMVYQDFTLQWGYRSDSEFKEKAKRMLAEMIYYLYNHPCIVLWCCHNEPLWVFERTIFKFGWSNKSLDDELFRTACEIDHTRPVHKASGWGDSHVYAGWYGGLFTDVRRRRDPFPTEFGAQAVPLNFGKWVKDAWPPKAHRWRYHDGQLSILCTYLGSWKKYRSLREFARASQLYQAELLKYYIEQYRLKKYEPTGGCLFFWFVNWWPSIAWGVLDHERNPMLAFKEVKRCFNPIFVCVDWEKSLFKREEEIRLPVWLINDLHRNFRRCLIRWRILETKNTVIEGDRKWQLAEFYLCWFNIPLLRKPVTVCPGETRGRILSSGEFRSDAPPDSRTCVGEIIFKSNDPLDIVLELELWYGKRLLSENRYNFLIR